MRRVALVLAVLATLLAAPASAANERARSVAPLRTTNLDLGYLKPPPAPPGRDAPTTSTNVEPVTFRRLTLTANPLALAVFRISANLDLLVAHHHALTASGYRQTISALATTATATAKTTYETMGGELGYRLYTGDRGANGMFVGAGGFLQSTTVEESSSQRARNLVLAANTSVFAYGPFVDLGGQHITSWGFTCGAGVGAMYVFRTGQPGLTSTFARFGGLLPRLLVTLGYSF